MTQIRRRIRPIEGFDGYYVSNDGKVYSQWVNKGRHGLVKEIELKELRCSVSKSGYLTVRLGGRGGVARSVHRLVYESFVGEIKPGLVIRHLNDIPDDNRIENLAIGTQKDNHKDAVRNGNWRVNRKVTKEMANEMKRMKTEDPQKPNRVIAEGFGVSRRTVDRIVKDLKRSDQLCTTK